MNYGYEYFCGANVVVEIEGMPILEASGFSMEIVERKMPIYGYSSRHFDAVARGQVIVQGSLIVNYVHQDYLFEAISLALEGDVAISQTASTELEDALGNAASTNEVIKEMISNYPQNVHLAQALKAKHWDGTLRSGLDAPADTELSLNPHDHFGGLDIKVTFGERSASNNNSGATGYLLSDVYFTGRGMPIRIDEEVIVEEYPFFARNVYTVRQPYVIQVEKTNGNEEEIIRTLQIPNQV